MLLDSCSHHDVLLSISYWPRNLVALQARAEASSSSSAAVIDVTKFGLFKVLGKGTLPEQPVLVKARFVSKHAEKKIKEAGGAVQLVA